MNLPRCWQSPALCLMRVVRLLFAYSLTLLLGVGVAQAQFRVDVSGVGLTQVPIAFSPFRVKRRLPSASPVLSRPIWSAAAFFARWRQGCRSMKPPARTCPPCASAVPMPSSPAV